MAFVTALAPHGLVCFPSRAVCTARAPLLRAPVRACVQPPSGGGAGQIFDSLREKAHSYGISSERVRELARRAMGHQAEALDVVDKIMGRAGVSADVVARVHGVLEGVDLERLVVDGDTARAKVLDLEKVLIEACGEGKFKAEEALGEGKEVGREVMRRFVETLDTDGDGHVSKEEIKAATVKFGSVVKALKGAQQESMEE